MRQASTHCRWEPLPLPFLPPDKFHSYDLWLCTYAMVPETEKYAHVTFFFNGGVEKQFEAEERHMIPSPKVCPPPPLRRLACESARLPIMQVATYDLQPEMSVQGVADKVAEVVKAGKHEFVMCNFAPPDMVCITAPLHSYCLPPYSPLLNNLPDRLATRAYMTLPSGRSRQQTPLSERCIRHAKRLATFSSSPRITGTRNKCSTPIRARRTPRTPRIPCHSSSRVPKARVTTPSSCLGTTRTRERMAHWQM